MAPTKGTALQNVRMTPELWAAFGKVAEPDRSTVIREFVRWYVHEKGATMPKRPPRRDDSE